MKLNLFKSNERNEKLFAAAGWTVLAVALLSGCGKAKKIELTEEEQRIANLSTGSGVMRDRSGSLRTFRPEEFQSTAGQFGFSTDAARDSQEMAQKTGAIVGLSQSPENLGKSFGDMMAHMKGKLNNTSEDFEVVFGIDYSGSMSNDIQGVIEGMQEITASLQKVQEAGRGVRIGIVTFGQQGKELVEMDLSSDLNQVTKTLQGLYDNYGSRTNSDDPGEASYHGLNLVANQISWTSKARFSLFVTDEESKELSSNRQEDIDYVKQVDADLKKNGVETSTYTILVR